MGSEEENKGTQEQGQEGKGNDTVTLSKEEYAEMVGKMNQMQGAIQEFLEKETEKGQKEEQEREAQRQRAEAAQRGPQKDLDLMTNKELAMVILTEVESRMGRPLLQMVSTLAVKDEKRDLEKYCEKNGENFEEYEEEIFKIATEKPTLSLMEAYKLAKSGRAPKAKEEPKKEEKGPKVGGEKPSSGKFEAGGKMSLEEASKKAFADLKDQFPE